MTEEMMEEMSEGTGKFNDMQLVKRRFFAMRNGVISTTLRQAGLPFQIIFGLNLPQITEIAAMFGPSRDLAERLWANSTTRESMLLAPMLMPRDEFTIEDAERWASQIPAAETADMLCFKLLKHMDYAPELAKRLAAMDGRMQQYTAVRLAVNIVTKHPEAALEVARTVAEKNADDKLITTVARQVVESVC